MNTDWDIMLKEYFNPKVIRGHYKIKHGLYCIMLLEGNELQFQCSVDGTTCRYTCLTYGKTYLSLYQMLE